MWKEEQTTNFNFFFKNPVYLVSFSWTFMALNFDCEMQGLSRYTRSLYLQTTCTAKHKIPDHG